MPRRFARVSYDIVFAKCIWLAHLRRDGSVENEAQEPGAFAIDDLLISFIDHEVW